MKINHWMLSACMITGLAFMTACTDDNPNANMDGLNANQGIQPIDGFDTTNNDANNGSDVWKNDLTGDKDPFGDIITEWKFPTIHFAYDSDALGQSEITKLSQVAEYLKSNSGVGAIIEGHSDERGTEEYNRALGERRALAVKNYLMNMGVQDARFKTISYGEDKPAIQGSGENAWMQNRRAELIPVKLRIVIQ